LNDGLDFTNKFMIHNKIDSNINGHYAVGISSPYNYPDANNNIKHFEGGILLQVAEDEQSRIRLNIEETKHLIELLQHNLQEFQNCIDKYKK